MPSKPLTNERLMALCEEAADKISKSAPASSELIVPHLYLVFKQLLEAEEPLKADPLPVLLRVAAALKDCVFVMSHELDGLKVIQPELHGARMALAEVNEFTGDLGQDDGASKALAIDPSMSQGQRVSVLRKAAGLSYQSLAQAMPEFPDLRLSRIERDGERPGQDQFGRLESYLKEVIFGER